MYFFSQRQSHFGQVNQPVSGGRVENIQTVSYIDSVTALQTSSNAKDWGSLNTAITNLLADSGLAQSAGSLIPKLKALQAKINTALNGKGPDLSSDISTAIADLINQAQIEASADANARLMNQEFLTQRIFNLNNSIQTFIYTKTGIINSVTTLAGKLTGSITQTLTPILNEIQDITTDIAITPLTLIGRNSLTNQIAVQQQNADSASAAVNSSMMKLGFYAFLIVVGPPIFNWIKSKAQEHAVKQAIRLRKRYIEGEETPEEIGARVARYMDEEKKRSGASGRKKRKRR